MRPVCEDIPWSKFHDALRREGVPERRLRWFTGWVECFARFHKDRPLLGRVPKDAENFLRALSERSGLAVKIPIEMG